MGRLTIFGEIEERLNRFRERNYDVECGWYVDDVSFLLGEIKKYRDAEEHGLLVVLPIKQYETVYYILNSTVYVGWYLAKPADHTHLVLQDKIEMGICWVSDDYLFLTRAEGEKALKAGEADGKGGAV